MARPCGCPDTALPPKGLPYPPCVNGVCEVCRVCWLFVNDTEYQKLWSDPVTIPPPPTSPPDQLTISFPSGEQRTLWLYGSNWVGANNATVTPEYALHLGNRKYTPIRVTLSPLLVEYEGGLVVTW